MKYRALAWEPTPPLTGGPLMLSPGSCRPCFAIPDPSSHRGEALPSQQVAQRRIRLRAGLSHRLGSWPLTALLAPVFATFDHGSLLATGGEHSPQYRAFAVWIALQRNHLSTCWMFLSTSTDRRRLAD